MLKKKILTNTGFNIISQVINFLFGIILARLLVPSDFGVYGISLFVVMMSSYATLRGFSVALIQINEAKEEHFTTVFYLNLVICAVLALGLTMASQYIERYFHMPSLALLLRWHVWGLIILSLEPISSIKLYRNLKFKEAGLALLFSKLAYGLTAVLFIKLNFGPLSLVFGYLSSELARLGSCLIYLGPDRFKGLKRFRLSCISELTHVGFGVMAQQVLGYFSANIDYFLLGKFTSAEILGFYTRAFRLMQMPVDQVSRNISKVLLSGFSRIQDDLAQIKNKLFKATQTTALVAFPVFTVGIVYAHYFILFVYGEKWLPAVMPLRVLIIAGAMKAITTYFGDALKARGIIYREILIGILNSTIIFFGGFFAIKIWGMVGMCYMVVVSALISWFAMLFLMRKVYGMGFRSYFAIFKPALVICGVMLLWSLLFLKISVYVMMHPLMYLVLGVISNMMWYFILISRSAKYTMLESEIDGAKKKVGGVFLKLKRLLLNEKRA